MDEEKRRKAREATKRWRERNPEKAKASDQKSNKKAYWKNVEKNRARTRAWQEANPERRKENHLNWRTANRSYVNEKQRASYLLRTYGITIEERDAMLENQNGCAVCHVQEPGNKYGWVVDHCHNSNKVRGILCHHCNLALGNVKDDPKTLRALADYLER